MHYARCLAVTATLAWCCRCVCSEFTDQLLLSLHRALCFCCCCCDCGLSSVLSLCSEYGCMYVHCTRVKLLGGVVVYNILIYNSKKQLVTACGLLVFAVRIVTHCWWCDVFDFCATGGMLTNSTAAGPLELTLRIFWNTPNHGFHSCWEENKLVWRYKQVRFDLWR